MILSDCECDFCGNDSDCVPMEKPALDSHGAEVGLRDKATACASCVAGRAAAEGWTVDRWAFGRASKGGAK